MKKLIVVFVTIAITAGAYAQTDTTNKKVSPRDNNINQKQTMQNNTIEKSNTDGVVMLNGKMMKMKNGQSTILDQEMTMSNGTKIASDGTYITKDGTKMTLKEGQRMDMAGNMIPKDKDKNMYLVPDSIKK